MLFNLTSMGQIDGQKNENTVENTLYCTMTLSRLSNNIIGASKGARC